MWTDRAAPPARGLAMGLALAVAASGCTSGTTIPVAQAPRLSADAPLEDGGRPVVTTSGDVLRLGRRESHSLIVTARGTPTTTYTSPMRVELREANGGVEAALIVEDRLDPASPACQSGTYCPPNDLPPRKVTYRVRDVERLELRRISPGKSVAAGVGITVALVAVAAAIFATVMAVGLSGMK